MEIVPSTASFDSDYERLLEIAKARREKRRKQIEDMRFFACSGGSNFFCVFGINPLENTYDTLYLFENE